MPNLSLHLPGETVVYPADRASMLVTVTVRNDGPGAAEVPCAWLEARGLDMTYVAAAGAPARQARYSLADPALLEQPVSLAEGAACALRIVVQREEAMAVAGPGDRALTLRVALPTTRGLPDPAPSASATLSLAWPGEEDYPDAP